MKLTPTKSLGHAAFKEVLTQFSHDPNKHMQAEVRHIFSVFRTSPEVTVKELSVSLNAAEHRKPRSAGAGAVGHSLKVLPR